MDRKQLSLARFLKLLQNGESPLVTPTANRNADCDLARRRRFLKAVAIGGVGLAGLGSSGLANALALPQDPDDEEIEPCTTTTTYSTSIETTITGPSRPSTTLSAEYRCTNHTARTHYDTFTRHPSYSVETTGVATVEGEKTFSWSQTISNSETSISASVSEICIRGFAAMTVSLPSKPSYTQAVTQVESGTKTVKCGSGGGGGNLPGTGEHGRADEAGLPPTLDDDRVVRCFAMPTDSEYVLQFIGPSECCH